MLLRNLLIYLFVGIVVDVLLSIFSKDYNIPYVNFPLIRFVIPLAIGFVFERDYVERNWRRPRDILPLVLIVIVIGLVLFSPIGHAVELFIESEYFEIMNTHLRSAGIYIFDLISDVFIFFVVGMVLSKIAEFTRSRRKPEPRNQYK